MSVFISYGGEDASFASRLAQCLLDRKVPVWLDAMNIGVGKAISESIERGLEKSRYFCLILSDDALSSPWVAHEIELALNKEAASKGEFVILPVLSGDCEIPKAFENKLVALRRDGFDHVLSSIITIVKRTYNLSAGQISNDDITTSFGTDVVFYEKNIEITVDILSQDDNFDHSILTRVRFQGNEVVLREFRRHDEEGHPSRFINELVAACLKVPKIQNAVFFVGHSDATPVSVRLTAEDSGFELRVDILSKKLGVDDGLYTRVILADLLALHAEAQTRGD